MVELLADSADRERQEQEQDGHADAIIEAALDVERFAYFHRNRRVGHDGLAERRVGRREHGREDRDLQQAELLEDRNAHTKAEGDGERQSDQEQTLRQREAAPQNPEIGVRRIREQDEGQGKLGEQTQPFGINVELEDSEPAGAREQPKGSVNDRATDQGPLETTGKHAVKKDKPGQDRQVPIHPRSPFHGWGWTDRRRRPPLRAYAGRRRNDRTERPAWPVPDPAFDGRLWLTRSQCLWSGGVALQLEVSALRDLHLFLIHFFRVTHLVRHILEALFACLLGIAVVIALAEHRSFGDAVYFTLITGLTVGYGDISPVTPVGRVASMILTGIYVAISTNAVSRALQAKIPREANPNVNAPG